MLWDHPSFEVIFFLTSSSFHKGVRTNQNKHFYNEFKVFKTPVEIAPGVWCTEMVDSELYTDRGQHLQFCIFHFWVISGLVYLHCWMMGVNMRMWIWVIWGYMLGMRFYLFETWDFMWGHEIWHEILYGDMRCFYAWCKILCWTLDYIWDLICQKWEDIYAEISDSIYLDDILYVELTLDYLCLDMRLYAQHEIMLRCYCKTLEFVCYQWNL